MLILLQLFMTPLVPCHSFQYCCESSHTSDNYQDTGNNMACRPAGRRGRSIAVLLMGLCWYALWINWILPSPPKHITKQPTPQCICCFVAWFGGIRRLHLYSINRIMSSLMRSYVFVQLLQSIVKPCGIYFCGGDDILISDPHG